MLPSMSAAWFAEHAPARLPTSTPIKVVQFGEGNFLRAFADWMFQRLNETGLFTGAVRVVQPIARGLLDRLAAQGYAYSLALRGREDGRTVDDARFVDVIRDGVNPYTEWARFLAGAGEPAVRYVVSNTTEAGIVYVPTPRPAGACPASFPAKVAAWLAARHDAVAAAPDRGVVFLPCELIERNGDHLRDAVLRHLADWGLGGTVGRWVDASCRFYNTLVDRIVAGFPADGAEELWARLGVRDDLLVAGEAFHLWVIEGDRRLEAELPFARAGLRVVVTDDLTPYRDRKVRVLNGAHTGCALAAFLAGVDTVGGLMADAGLSAFLQAMVREEILPGVRLPDAERRGYARAVFERFRNPFVRHELLSISLNSVSKWKVRVLPSLKDFVAATGTLPRRLAFSLAALIAFYRGAWDGGDYAGRRGDGRPYPIRDDRSALDALDAAWRAHADDPAALARAALADATLWDEDLTAVPGLADAVAAGLAAIRARGMRAAVEAR